MCNEIMDLRDFLIRCQAGFKERLRGPLISGISKVFVQWVCQSRGFRSPLCKERGPWKHSKPINCVTKNSVLERGKEVGQPRQAPKAATQGYLVFSASVFLSLLGWLSATVSYWQSTGPFCTKLRCNNSCFAFLH